MLRSNDIERWKTTSVWLCACIIVLLPMAGAVGVESAAAAAMAALPARAASAPAAALPADVQRFLQRAELCEHFAGEFNGDGSQRDREVNAELARHHCDRVAAELKTLKRRYAKNAAVAQRLANIE